MGTINSTTRADLLNRNNDDDDDDDDDDVLITRSASLARVYQPRHLSTQFARRTSISSACADVPEPPQSYTSLGSKPQKMITNQSSLLMGPSPPPLYEMALLGLWQDLMVRVKRYPNEVLYRDKCNNTPLHLACRRQPPVLVVKCLIDAIQREEHKQELLQRNIQNLFSTTRLSEEKDIAPHGNINSTETGASTSLEKDDRSTVATYPALFLAESASLTTNTVTLDGLTALHFATYCGAAPEVIDLLLDNEYKKFQYQRMHETAHTPVSIPTNIQQHDLSKSTSSSASVSSTGTSSSSNHSNKFKLPTDRRGRTPLHAICAGFRATHRPAIIHSLLYYDPDCVLLEDEKLKTSLSLLYDDYAEEIEDVLKLSMKNGTIRRKSEIEKICFLEKGSMNECWKILVLLLKAAYLGTVVDEETPEVDDSINEDNLDGRDDDDDLIQLEDEHEHETVHLPQSILQSSLLPSLQQKKLFNNENKTKIDIHTVHFEVEEKEDENCIDYREAPVVDDDDDDSDGDDHVNDDHIDDKNNSDTIVLSNIEVTGQRSRITEQRPRITEMVSTQTPPRHHHDITMKTPIIKNTRINSQIGFDTPTPASLSFSLIHAAASIPYSCPYGFFQLLLRVCGTSTVEEYENGVLPIHLATKSLPPTQLSYTMTTNAITQRRQNLSTTFHGTSSLFYEDPSTGVSISYHLQSKYSKSKQYRTVSCSSSLSSSSSSQSTSWSSSSSSTASTSSSKVFSTKSMHSIETPLISHLIDVYPDGVKIAEPSSGKYPIELAIESGKTYHSVISPLIDVFPELIFDKNLSNASNILVMNDKEKTILNPRYHNTCESNMERIYTSLLNALMNPLISIRDEAAITVGCLMKRCSQYLDNIDTPTCDQDDNTTTANTAQIDPTSLRVEEFLKTLIKKSDGSINLGQVKEDPYSNAHFLTDDEWANIQSTTLRALYYALSNISPRMISVGTDLPRKALDVAEKMIRHENIAVRESASFVIGSTLDWLGDEAIIGLLDRLLMLDSCDKRHHQQDHENDEILSIGSLKGSKLSNSMHSLFSAGSNPSIKTQKASNGRSSRSIGSLLSSSLHSTDHNAPQFHLPADIKHGKALACLRIITAIKNKDIITAKPVIFDGMISMIKLFMVDNDVMVRQAACLAMGAILGKSVDTTVILEEVRRTILKCMSMSEDEDVHLALARGLMIATNMKPQIFVCKAGTPILEGALKLSVSSPMYVQKMFHAFLFLALGIGEKETAHAGLSEYMSLAEGENGLIMMNLVTKTLARIKSVNDVLWS